MTETMTFAATLEECEVETSVSRSYRAYRFKQADPVVALAVAALERTGYAPTFTLSGGGADANVFNERGLACLNIANGMAEIHTPDEHIAVSDLDGMVEVTLALLDAARTVPA
jgi:tripeptide aminopeptidase